MIEPGFEPVFHDDGTFAHLINEDGVILLRIFGHLATCPAHSKEPGEKKCDCGPRERWLKKHHEQFSG